MDYYDLKFRLAEEGFWQISKKLVLAFDFETALFLQNIIEGFVVLKQQNRLSKFKNDDRDYIYQTRKTIEDNTGLSAYKQRKCEQKLKECSLIHTRVGKNNPKGPTLTFYSLNIDDIIFAFQLNPEPVKDGECYNYKGDYLDDPEFSPYMNLNKD